MSGILRSIQLIALLSAICNWSGAADALWRRASSERGELPVVFSSTNVTAIAVGDFDKNNTNDFIVGAADLAPSLVLIYRATNWNRLPIELDGIPIAPGGAGLDVDRDDDLDVIFGTTSGAIYWWENPAPDWDGNKSWVRHTIKEGNGRAVWGSILGNFVGDADLELVFWEQGSSTLYAAAIPREARTRAAWELTELFSPKSAGPKTFLPYGLSAADINVDGQSDLLAANFWFKRDEQNQLNATQVSEPGGLMATGRFNEGTYPQLVATGGGRLRWFECRLAPEKADSWGSHDLLYANIKTLGVADFNRDGRDDVFAATGGILLPNAEQDFYSPQNSWILYGDGRGNFKTTLLPSTNQWQTVAIGDLNKDTGADLVGYTRAPNPHLEIWLNESSPIIRPAVAVPPRK